MRVSVAVLCLLVVGCAGPHTTGALWAQQNLDSELQLFHLSDAQRADQARTFEHGLADETLASERSRIEAGLQACPGQTRQPLGVSVGDRARDVVRLRVQGDATRLATLAQVALADWRLRRAQTTGDTRFCDQARVALNITGTATTEASNADVLGQLGSATVTRDPLRPAPPSDTGTLSVALSNYAFGYVDTVQAASPLPQYLAAVYGGTLVGTPPTPTLNGTTPAALVDQLAPAYPAWEPDALYAAFSAS